MKMSENVVAAIDVGGTKIAVALQKFDKEIVGGGVSMAGEVLLKPLRCYISQNVKMLPIEKVKILQTSPGSESGIYGALLLAQQAIDNH